MTNDKAMPLGPEMIRRIHHYGYPADPRLAADVEADVEASDDERAGEDGDEPRDLIPLAELERRIAYSAPILRELAKMGLIEITEREAELEAVAIGEAMHAGPPPVLTDEQAHDSVGEPAGKGYMVNVATYQHGVGEGRWTRIDGWSERILDYVRAVDAELEP